MRAKANYTTDPIKIHCECGHMAVHPIGSDEAGWKWYCSECLYKLEYGKDPPLIKRDKRWGGEQMTIGEAN